MNEAYKLIYSIRERKVNIDIADCKNLFTSTNNRLGLQKVTNGSQHVDYNLFGTVTGRLATYPGSFPILTMKKDFRRVVKPHNDWFLSLDYNGAEVRTVLSLLGHPQPTEDIHAWNVANVFNESHYDKIPDRADAKVLFFGWLYNPDSNVISNSVYDRDALLDKFYDNDSIKTTFGREIKVNNFKALNYLIQSTTADLVNERAVKIDALLEGKKSFVSHIVHDEVIVDLHDEDRDLVPEIEKVFSNNKLGYFKTNICAGKNYYDLGVLKI